MARHGRERLGNARQARQAWQGKAWPGAARLGRQGEAWLGGVRRGGAWFGMAGHY